MRNTSLRLAPRSREAVPQSASPVAHRLLPPSSVVHGWWPSQTVMSTTTRRVRPSHFDRSHHGKSARIRRGDLRLKTFVTAMVLPHCNRRAELVGAPIAPRLGLGLPEPL